MVDRGGSVRGRTWRAGVWAALAIAVLVVGSAIALAAGSSKSPHRQPRWKPSGHSNVPFEYFQGVTSDRRHHLYFSGIFTGLYRTGLRLREQARNPDVIPAAVMSAEGYNHVGDITWDGAEGGRVLLPLECYSIVAGNTCKTGSIGVADPRTLRWRYYVKLDPAFIDKAMWAEVSPDGKLLWTSSGSGKDLLAYRVSDVTAANAAPAGPRLVPVRRLVGAVPPSGITGATFYRGRLLLAGQGRGRFELWSIDLGKGSRRLEIRRSIAGESEGLDVVRLRTGLLHWLVAPTRGRPPTFGLGHSALMNFVPRSRARR